MSNKEYDNTSKIIFSEKSLSVHMSPSRPRPPKKSLKLKTLLSKVVRQTIRVTKIHPVMLPPLLHATAAAAATKTSAFLGEAKPSYVYSTQFRVSSPLQSRSKAVVCASTPRKYPRSGYFLVHYISLNITNQNLMLD